MIGIGVILHRVFQLDIRTLSRLNFYLFSPTFILLMIYESNLSMTVLLDVLSFFCLFFIALWLTVEVMMRLRGYKSSMRSAMRNSILFYNSGNYGLPLNQLVFSFNSFTLAIQIIIMMLQALIPNTYGVYSVNAHKQKWKATLKTIASLPVIYAIPIAFMLKGFDLTIAKPLLIPIQYVAQSFIATALLTLGVQLGSMRWEIHFSDVLISNFFRLCIAPALGFVIAIAMGLEGLMAQALIISCAVPTSLSCVLLAVEFDNEPEFSSQAVFSSTMLSIVTVTVVIYLTQLYYG